MGLSSGSADPKRASHWAETFWVVGGAAVAAGATAFAEPRCVNSVSMSNCLRPRCRRSADPQSAALGHDCSGGGPLLVLLASRAISDRGDVHRLAPTRADNPGT